jgi:CHAT domain-containing protein
VETRDREYAAWALAQAGAAKSHLGEAAGARADLEKAKAEQEVLGDEWRLAATIGNLATVRADLGHFHEAFDLHRQALALVKRLGNEQAVAASHLNLGNLHHQLGQFQSALVEHTKARDLFEAMGDPGGVALALGNLANDHDRLGDTALAIELGERALAAKEKVGDRAGAGNTLANLAVMHHRIGEAAKAEAYARRSVEIAEKGRNAQNLALALSGLATILGATDRLAEALSLKERALAIREQGGNQAWVAGALADVGTVKMKLGDLDGAAKALGRALQIAEKIGKHESVSHTASNLAFLHAMRGDLAAAAQTFDRAVVEADLASAPGEVVYACSCATEAWARVGDDAKALAAAARGGALVGKIVRGLADEQAAHARGSQVELFSWGALAAARLGDATSALRFLEDGRAGAFLESMRTRDALRGTALPTALLEAEESARHEEAAAATACRAALALGDRAAIRKAKEALAAASDAVQAVVERIQREQKKAASVLYPRSDDAKSIARLLAPGDALVLYSLHVDQSVAVVVTPAGVRAVPLGESKKIRDACDALGLEEPSAGAALAPAAVEGLRALAITPLGLGSEIKRLLVSPEGALSYVPFALLVPEMEVAYVPSGTTLGLLREDAGPPGQGVLALADPDYAAAADASATSVYVRQAGTRGGFSLVPLPHTRDEALAVSDSSLLGKDATEARLRDALQAKKGRLRAVHFACHGLVDPDHPGLCALAVTPAPPDDGFFTATEVLRTEIPADLVVLSACETGRGRVLDGEGILGLTRAFMYAGAPRVLCSLWKVDDEATRALMTKFYALWNPRPASSSTPGAGSEAKHLFPAAALRAAQDFVRAQEKWKHPYYWAAWVLWGLPD